MPKPMYVWTGTAWVSVASEVESLATYATQSYADNQPGMKMVVPTSVAVGSGSGSVATQGTVTFSGASSISLNGCFTSTYNNYKIMLEIDSTSTNNDIRSRLRASGTDDSNSQYIYAASIGVSSGSVTYMGSGGKLSYWRVLSQATADGPSTLSLDIYAPKSTAKTSGTGTAIYRTSSTALESWALGLSFDSTTSFDGITFYTSTGTATGTVRVYGYKIG